jgi:hypothetical protein
MNSHGTFIERFELSQLVDKPQETGRAFGSAIIAPIDVMVLHNVSHVRTATSEFGLGMNATEMSAAP